MLEGLAECFVKEVFVVDPAPWSIALTEDEAHGVLGDIEEYLSSTDTKLHSEVLYGGQKYPKWAGYSLGYRIISAFRKQNPLIKWEEIIKLDPFEILKKSNFKKA